MQTQAEEITIESICVALGNIIERAAQPGIGKELHERLKATPYPNDTAQRCLWNMLRELALYIGKE